MFIRFHSAIFSHVSSAVTIGTDMLELDCHITKDEQVVVSHDANLKRSTGINVNVSDLKYCVSKNKRKALYVGLKYLRQKRARCHYNKWLLRMMMIRLVLWLTAVIPALGKLACPKLEASLGSCLKTNRNWRDGFSVESTGCSSRQPCFCSQHPHGTSQLSVTPVPGDPTQFLGLCRY